LTKIKTQEIFNNEKFEESLIIKQLLDGKLYTHFQFSTTKIMKNKKGKKNI
jgi:hypothetical protein